MLDPDARYPWEKRKGENEMETHEQFISMAGIMHCSLKENWNKASSDGKRVKETQQKITKSVVHQDARIIGIQTKIYTSGGDAGRVQTKKGTI